MSPSWPASDNAVSRLELKPLGRSEWDEFISAHPDATLFHTSAWLDLCASVYNLRWAALGVWSESQLNGVFPLQERRLGPFQLGGSPLMQVIASTPFLGPLISPEQIPEFLLALNHFLQVKKIDHIELSFPYLLSQIDEAVKLGYSPETCQAVVLELQSQTCEQLWIKLSSSCRRAVRKTIKNAVEIVQAQDGDFIDEYYTMCQEVYRNAGRKPHLSKEFYRAAWTHLYPEGKIVAFLAVNQGEILAGGIFLIYRDQAYYLSGASYDHGLSFRPNNLIQWRFIEWARKHGIHTYDMGGAAVPGITRFKLSFGGSLQAYTRIHKSRTLPARLGRSVYQILLPYIRKLQARW